MADSSDCKHNTDVLRLMHEGSSQDLRVPKALDPGHVPVNERGPEYGLVFAKAYSAYLNYYDSNNSVTGDWQSFFDKDVSVLLAVAAIQDVDAYRSAVKACFDFLNNSANRTQAEALKQRLGFLFSIAATMAKQLDRLKENLPVDTALKSLLQSRIQSQSAQGFKRLIAYYKAYESDFGLTDDELDVAAELTIFGQEAQAFGDIYRSPFSKDWIIGNSPDWLSYLDGIDKDSRVFGEPLLDSSDSNYWFSILNPIASHNLFTSIFDEFLKIYARIVIEAKQELENSFIQNGNHEPHYALLIAFLRLFEGTRAEINTLTGRHLDFYYRDILRLKEKPAEPPRVHLLAELAKHADSHCFDSGVSFKAGKDDSGIEAFFTSDRDFIANKAKVAALKTVYRHGGEAVLGLGVNAAKQSGRYYASPVADSEDGLGAKLTNEEQSWHPFFNKRYSNAQLDSIAMPEAELGFAIASHYLWLAEGERTVTVELYLSDIAFNTLPGDLKTDLVCSLSTEEGWLEKPAMKFESVQGRLQLKIKLSGADPAITAYSPKVHGFDFSINLPILLVKFRHQSDRLYPVSLLANAVIDKIGLNVAVKGLRTLKVSNDFGSVVTSKPFQPFGPSPVANSSLILGSKEAFQKRLLSAKVNWQWQNPPEPFGTQVNINIGYLQSGTWKQATGETIAITSDSYTLDSEINQTVVDAADFNEPVFYNSAARHGFVRFSTSEGFGQDEYEKALIDYIRKLMDNDKELARGVQAAVDFIGQINTRVQDFNDLHNSVIENLSQLPTQMAEVTNDLIENFPEVIENTEKVFEKINQVYGATDEGIKDAIKSLLEQFPDVGIDVDTDNYWSNLSDLPTDNVSGLILILIKQLNLTVKNLSNLKDTVVDIAKEIENRTGVANLTQTVNTFLSLVANTYDDINRIASEMIKLDNAAKWVTEKTSVVMSAGSQLVENFGAQIVQFNNNVAGLVAGVSTMVEGIGEVLGDEPIKPKPPTGPWMTELTLDYTTGEQMIALDSADSGIWRNRQAFFFHLAPFGHCEQHPFLNSTRKVYLIPGFRFQQDHGEIMSEAEFYIGLTGLEPPQNLSLLFQVADGTADPLTIKPDPHIHWSYLRGNEWIAFKKDEVEDGTGGLLNSGIIRFALPNDADNNNSILPSGMHWLRAAVASHSEAVCRLQAVSAQALQATFSDRGNDPGFSAKPLKAGTISKLERPDAAVKKIEQPFSSFGGRGAETPAAFYTRVSERLRHKDRAVALWGYEHLVLEAFPQIYRVKCLNHTRYEPGENGDFIYRELAPGHVTLVAIPNQQFQTLRDPLKPYTSLGLLDEIKAFLSARVSCFVNLHVRNPRFETVRCSCKVRFHEGIDETFYSNTLRQAITRFLSPWAFANDAKPSFGGKIHQSALIRFIEEQTYVDYLTDFVLYHDSGGAAGEVAVDEAQGSTAVSVLVSAPTEKHQIDVIKPAAMNELGETCPCEP